MHISEINIYPIKSLKRISLDCADVEARGLKLDRRWVLTDAKGDFLTQREMPKMATICVALNGNGVVASDGNTSIAIDPLTEGEREMVQVWGSESEALAYDKDINRWFSQALDTEVRLYYMPEDAGRPLNPRFDRGGELLSFADGYPLMLIGAASLRELNERIADSLVKPEMRSGRGEEISAESSGLVSRRVTITPPAEPGTHPKQGEKFLREPLLMDRFRPNLVVEGCRAFAEDSWRRIMIGNVVFRTTKPCVRCVMTTVDQATGEFTGKEPLRTLASFRLAKDIFPSDLDRLGLSPNGVLFGQNLVPETHGAVINVGDEIEILGE